MALQVERRLLRRYLLEAHDQWKEGHEISREEFQKLQQKYERLLQTDKEVIQLLEDGSADEEELEKEIAEILLYKDKMMDISLAFKNRGPQDGRGNVQNPVEETKKLKLPKIELPKFNGDIKKWTAFFQQFKKIHESTEIGNDLKFHYLIQSLEGPAKDFISSYQVIEDNYERAFIELKNRFAKEELLVDVYVRDFMTIITNQGKVAELTLRQFYDQLIAHINNLEALNVNVGRSSIFLVPIIESCLPSHLLQLWERKKCERANFGSNLSLNNSQNKITEILSFIQAEVEVQDKIEYVQKTGSASSDNQIFTAAGLVATGKQAMKSRNYQVHSTTGSVTMGTMVGHYSKNCKGLVKCIKCQNRHHPIMCPQLSNLKEPKKEESDVDKEKGKTNTLVCNTRGRVSLQTLQVNIIHNDNKHRVRVLIDPGSHFSYIQTELAERLGLKPLGKTSLIHGLFGGNKTGLVSHQEFCVRLQNLDGKYEHEFCLLSQEVICNDIPQTSTETNKEVSGLGILITDTDEGPREIEVLIGADNIPRILTDNVKHINDDLAVVEFKLGWCTIGRCSDLVAMAHEVATSMNCVSEFWSLENMGIKECVETETKRERDIELITEFQKEIKMVEGRYEVKLPFKDNEVKPNGNKRQAFKRLWCVKNKLDGSGKYNAYDEVLQMWRSEGIVEMVKEPTLFGEDTYFLPHRPVFKENRQTTKVRPVFDAGAKSTNGISLNDCLQTGPNLIEDIPRNLIKWRLNEFAATADVKSAFLAIGINQVNRDDLKFLWFDETGEVREWRHKRLVFGLVCSPFILKATLNFHLEQEVEFAETARMLQDSFYCDNMNISFRDRDELLQFVSKSYEVMKKGGFILREWAFNLPEQYKERLQVEQTPLEKVKVLGMIWNTSEDAMCSDTWDFGQKTEGIKLTKRIILSWAQKAYDPLGMWNPATLLPKVILQKLWKDGITWDEEVADEIKTEIIQWVRNIEVIKNTEIERWLSYTPGNMVTYHVFCDSSAIAYATCIYLRSESEKGAHTSLILSKSRLCPIKTISIPRLELLACVLGVRMFNSIKNVLPEGRVHYWTDSTVAIDWINGNGKLDIFVKNRVEEIRKNSSIKQWNHVKGINNLADVLTRPTSAQQLIKIQWWQGSDWLRGNEWKEEIWPDAEIAFEAVCTTSETVFKNMFYFSKYKKLVRSFAWIIRFIQVLKRKRQNKIGQVDKELTLQRGDITGEEYKCAESVLIREIQKDIETEKLGNMEIFSDKEGVLRVKTRLVLGDFDDSFKTPVLLPYDNPVVEILVRDFHKENKHASASVLRTMLREDYFIVHCKKLTRRVVKRCVTCRKVNARKGLVATPPLPQPRINLGPAFETIGVDYAGPLYLKNKSKAWVALFTCATYRAIHLELVETLSTEGFILALRRFIARRGRCRIVYSDQGTNFIGLSNALKELDWNKIRAEGFTPIIWRHIPAGSPWWGGFYERMVSLMKDLLKKVLGKSSLTYEQLYTVLCSCESTINERPLTYTYADPGELQPLTPAMFIREVKTVDTEPIDLNEVDDKNIQGKNKYLNSLREQLRERFRKEYLSELVQFKNKVGKIFRVGDVVMVEVDNIKRINWPMGRIIEVIKGADGKDRLARIQIGKGVVVRPFQRLYDLEISNCDDFVETKDKVLQIQGKNKYVFSETQDKQKSPIQTRSGRTINPVMRLGF